MAGFEARAADAQCWLRLIELTLLNRWHCGMQSVGMPLADAAC